MNTTSTTANIGDIFSNNTTKNYDFSFSWAHNNIVTLQSLKNFDKEQWKSIRITLLYNTVWSQSSLQSKISSQYKYTLLPIDDTTVTILFDLQDQKLTRWSILLDIDTTTFDDKDIPIIQSIELFDNDVITPLSFNQPSSDLYH
jgi:hypothetical protein